MPTSVNDVIDREEFREALRSCIRMFYVYSRPSKAQKACEQEAVRAVFRSLHLSKPTDEEMEDIMPIPDYFQWQETEADNARMEEEMEQRRKVAEKERSMITWNYNGIELSRSDFGTDLRSWVAFSIAMAAATTSADKDAALDLLYREADNIITRVRVEEVKEKL